MPAQLNSTMNSLPQMPEFFMTPAPLQTQSFLGWGRGLQQLLEEYFDRQLLKYMVRKLLALY